MFRRFSTIIGYLIVSLLIIGGTFALVAYGQGYSYDFTHHKLVRHGLVLVGSTPNGASVYKNGIYTKHHTSYRASYSPGKYLMSVSKDGFRSWSKTLEVFAGQVVDAHYIILLPNTLVKTDAATVKTVFATPATSRDHRHIAYSSAPTATEGAAIWTVDLPGGQPTKQFSLPAATATVPAETIVSIDWSGDASHLLVVSQGATGRVYRVIAADGSNPIDLTDQYKFDFTNLKFTPTDWHQLYWLSADGSLRRLDLNSQAISGVLADNVTQFDFAADRVIYVQTTSLGRSLEMFALRDTTHKSTLAQSLPQSPTYSLSYANYQNTDEVVVIPSSTHEATLFSGAFGSSPVSSVVARGVDAAAFSPDGHFVAMYSANNLVTYDLQLSTPLHTINYTSSISGNGLTKLNWFDNYHLLLSVGGQTVFSDFDGTNQVPLGLAVDGTQPLAAPDMKSVYDFETVVAGGQKLVNIGVR